MRETLKIGLVALVALVLALLVLAPVVTIWSLNTLFAVGIEYTFWTWLAVVWLSMVTFGGITYNTRRDRN